MRKYSILLNEESHEVNGKTFEWKKYMLYENQENYPLPRHCTIIEESDNREKLKETQARLNDRLGNEAFAIVEDSNRLCFIAAAEEAEWYIEVAKLGNYRGTSLENIILGNKQSFSQCCYEMDGIYPRE